MDNEIKLNSVVQFNEKHKWCGCLGMVTEIKKLSDGVIRYMIGVPMPQKGVAYIFTRSSDKAIEYIGKGIMIIKEREE